MLIRSIIIETIDIVAISPAHIRLVVVGYMKFNEFSNLISLIVSLFSICILKSRAKLPEQICELYRIAIQ